MGLLSDIQTTLLDGGSLAGALLKMRVLAARLGSGELADWVRFEAEGYPPEAELPDYRRLPMAFSGHFSGPLGKEIRNAPIPDAVIYALVGENALVQGFGESVSSVDRLAAASEDGVLTTNLSNYPLFLQGKVYPGYNCISVTGRISASRLADINVVVRSKLLDLTLEIEKRIPEAKAVVAASKPISGKQQEVSSIVNQTVYGSINTIQNSGDHSNFTTNISQGNISDVTEHLAKGGINESDAKDFADILASEKPMGKTDPLGPKAKSWISANIGKAMNGGWKVGLPVATALLTAAAEHYYGLK